MRYERLRLLGRGGFGEVWLARDTKLDRQVAVKSLLPDAVPADIARFQREAHLAAKLSHSNIVAIHDVGERELVMDFVDGASAASRTFTPREAAELIRQAADAVHYAHGQGVVHRDLKPANIMVADGKAMVLDFGLAKRHGVDSSLSMTGDIMGTPVYMPPEQARGDLKRIGPRSDVYSLGATLYAMIAGAPPFEGAEVFKVIMHVLHDEPATLDADRDLAVIVQKAMCKEPEGRYATAGELAADLRRYLAGEPIVARPTTIVQRLRRHVRRHPWAWGVATALTVGLIAGMSVQQYRHSMSEESLRSIGEADAAIQAWRAERYLVVHDVTPARRRLNVAADRLRAALEIDPDAAELHGKLGWVLFELGRLDEAATALEAANRLDPDEGSYQFWLGRAERDRVNREVMRRLRYRGNDPPTAEQRRRAEAARLMIARASSAPRWTQAREWEREYSRLTALPADADLDAVKADYERCSERFAEGGEEFLMALAVQHEDARESLEHLRRACERARSWGRPLYEAAQLEAFGAERKASRGGGDPDAVMKDAVGMADTAVGIDPESTDAHMARSIVYATLGTAQLRVKRDPTAAFAAAREALSRASELDPRAAEVFAEWSQIEFHEAAWIMITGGDAGPKATEAEALANRALALDPGLGQAHYSIADLRLFRGELAVRSGEDSVPWIREAIEAYDRVEGLMGDPNFVAHHRGTAWSHLATAQLARGENASEALAAAEHDLDVALVDDPGNFEAALVLCSVYEKHGRFAASKGEDPFAWIDRAAELYGRILDAAPDHPSALEDRGTMLLNVAVMLLESGEDGELLLEDALADLDRAVELMAGSAGPWMTRGQIRATLARVRRERGQPADGLVEGAMRDYAEAERIDPADAQIPMRLGHLGYQEAMMGEGDPRRWFESAVAALRRSVELKPDLEQGWEILGMTEANWALRELQSGAREEAERHYATALEVTSRTARAATMLMRAELHDRFGRREEAKRDARRAVEMDPSLADQAAGLLGEDF